MKAHAVLKGTGSSLIWHVSKGKCWEKITPTLWDTTQTSGDASMHRMFTGGSTKREVGCSRGILGDVSRALVQLRKNVTLFFFLPLLPHTEIQNFVPPQHHLGLTRKVTLRFCSGSYLPGIVVFHFHSCIFVSRYESRCVGKQACQIRTKLGLLPNCPEKNQQQYQNFVLMEFICQKGDFFQTFSPSLEIITTKAKQ